MAERVEHAGFLGILSFGDDGYTIVWRPKDPQWRHSAAVADVESVTHALYSEVIATWEVAVDTFIDLYREDQPHGRTA